MKINIRPLFRESAQKRNTSRMVNGRLYGTTKAPGGSFIYYIQDNPKKRRLAIPLDRVIKNPYEGVKTLPAKWMNKGIEDLPTITKQTELEIKYNLPEGHLTTESFRIGSKGPRTYLQSLNFRFNDGNNEIDTSTLDGELLMEAIEESTIIANSYSEAISKQTRFYIERKQEEEAETLVTKRKVRKAEVMLDKLLEELTPYLIKVTTILKITKGVVRPTAAEIKLIEYLENVGKVNGKSRMARLDEFVKLVQLAASKRPDDKRHFKTMLLLQELVNYGVVSTNKGRYTWESKSGTDLEVVGRTYNEAILWLKDKDNKVYVEDLEAELKPLIRNV